jgi:hypothetical protein
VLSAQVSPLALCLLRMTEVLGFVYLQGI